MANQGWLTTKGVPFLNGSEYVLWKVRMEAYLMAFDVHVWCSSLNGEKSEKNEESKEIIMKGLSKPDVEEVVR